MYSQQTVVFVHVATKCPYWNKCSVCVSILLPYKNALPTAVVWSVDYTIHINRFIIRKPALVICVNTLRCITVSI